MAEFAERKVCVLLASYNGREFIGEQVASILSQQGVRTFIYVSDDDSRDGTRELVSEIASVHSNLVMLSPMSNSGAAQNFLRLSREVSIREFDYVAFADQDDIWLPDKLLDGIKQLDQSGCDVYSSDVLAFWPNGQREKIVKSQPQRQLDHFFEAAGPGCTYIAKMSCFAEFQEFLNSAGSGLSRVRRHDWLFYAWARSAGYKWTISKNIGLLYRQHDRNEAGANVGLRSMITRLVSLNRGWYTDQVRLIARLLAADYSASVPDYVLNLKSFSLLRRARSLRRRPLEAWLIAFWLVLNPGR
jgi:rhamnosyltransferase